MGNNVYINDLQNTYAYQEYVKDYLDNNLSALANQGQRFGIKGEGIQYSHIECYKIFGIDPNLTSIDNLLLKLQVNHNSLEGSQIYNLKTKKVDSTITIKSQEFNDQLSFKDIEDNEILNNIITFSLNDIDKFSKDSFIKITDNLFTGFIQGRIDQEENAELIYFQYNIHTNKLLHQIVTKYYGKINEYDDWYIVYKLDYKENSEDEYYLNIYLYRAEWLSQTIQSAFNDTKSYVDLVKNYYIFNDNSDDQNYDDMLQNQLLTLFNEAFVDYNKFNYFGPQIQYISFLNFIFNFDYTTLKEYGVIKFNTLEFTISDNNINVREIANAIYADSSQTNIYGYISQNELIVYLSNLEHLYNIYYQLYLYYNSSKYFSTENDTYLYKYVIYKLYTEVRELYKIDTNDDIIYIPLKYVFNILKSDTDDKLYFIDNIYINFISDIKYIDNVNNKIYYVHKNITNHTSVYEININYNDLDVNKIISNIVVNKLYTLPYVNKLNNWVIDNIETSSSISQNQYAGIKNIYLYTSLSGENYKTELLNISDESIIRYFKYTNKEFVINKKYFLKYNNVDVKCKTQIPELSENDLLEFFKNTILISICDKNTIDEEYGIDYAFDYIYSLWKVNESTQEFELISLDGKYAYDPFNNMSVVNQNQEYQFIMNLMTTKPVSNDPSSIIKDNNELVIRNKLAMYYNSIYSNNYNAIIEYANQTPKDGSNPIYNTLKYIESINDLETTNSLYPVYQIKFVVESVDELEHTLREIQRPNYTTYISIIVNGQNQLVTEYDNKMDMASFFTNVDIITKKYKYVEVGVVYSPGNNIISKYYNEYVFNQNVPTIDLKEVFIRNVNNLNRVNILSVQPSNAENGTKIYNGFIGTKPSIDKSTLYISTDDTNINVGVDTLFNSSQINKFSKYNTFEVNGFENINLLVNNGNNITIDKNKIQFNSNKSINANNTFISNYQINHQTIHQENLEDVQIYSTSITLSGMMNGYLLIQNSFTDNLVPTFNIVSPTSSYELLSKSNFIPIVSDYFEQNTQDNHQYELLYNSINLKLLLEPIFSELFTTNEFEYICSNKLLECKYNEKNYPLFIFKDSILQDYESSKLYTFNYQLNIQMIINPNQDFTNQIYINFDNSNIDTFEGSSESLSGSKTTEDIILLTNNYLSNTTIGGFYVQYNQIYI